MRHIDFVLVGDGYDPRPSDVRRIIELFNANGFSSHSPACLLGRYIIKHCVEEGIPFSLTHHVLSDRTAGWTIRRDYPNEQI